MTRNKNNRTRHFLLAPVLQSISDEMLKLGWKNRSTNQNSYNELNTSHSRQNKMISSLIDLFTKQGLDLDSA